MDGRLGSVVENFSRIHKVQNTLLRWFRVHQRDLPWRHTKDPYKILVSEIMLQQTQVDRVMPKYRPFLRRFPTVQALARATPRDVLLAWEGMGYNRRALYLLRAAQDIVQRFHGRVPTDPVLLRTLPGIGDYTAAAVATFSTGVPYALADVNVRRVMGRVFLGAHPVEQKLTQAIQDTTPHQAIAGFPPGMWGHAVMDFGALVCKAKPRCEACPLQQHCKAYPQLQLQDSHNRSPRANRGLSGPRFASTSSGRGESRRGNRSGSHPNIPDRIYRGKILQLIREHDPRPLSLRAVSAVLADISAARLRRLVRGLENDGLLVATGRTLHFANEGIPVRQPAGS
ncbi:MAG: A/G-specific adenine glycosylase [Parcubacteria group bacterium Gr01-1014_106]|nr:MAG: A/G-specific adenine glycosylase [Parcubacteria group bacterium Gr01-1014_106]